MALRRGQPRPGPSAVWHSTTDSLSISSMMHVHVSTAQARGDKCRGGGGGGGRHLGVAHIDGVHAPPRHNRQKLKGPQPEVIRAIWCSESALHYKIRGD